MWSPLSAKSVTTWHPFVVATEGLFCELVVHQFADAFRPVAGGGGHDFTDLLLFSDELVDLAGGVILREDPVSRPSGIRYSVFLHISKRKEIKIFYVL